jgi:hypothetical protein
LRIPSRVVIATIGLLPGALLLRGAAFAMPDVVEAVFAQRLYPLVARTLGGLNGLLPIPFAELAVLNLAIVAVGLGVRWWRSADRQRGLAATARSLLLGAWGVAGLGVLAFLLLWGFNYARPPLRSRLDLNLAEVQADEVLALASYFVAEANAAYLLLDADPAQPTLMPHSDAAADALIDTAYRRLALPGDTIDFDTSPVKGLLSSAIFSRLGIAGIFVPFTGEPLINRLMPGVSKPVAMAHEKAHQRGITDEGEANLAAVLAALTADDVYFRYAAALYASSTLIGAAGRYVPEEAQVLAAQWAPGPRRDLAAVRDFWAAHRGVATRAATRVNDAYLRSNRVEGGVQSYGRVASMLVGLERTGQLPGGR